MDAKGDSDNKYYNFFHTYSGPVGVSSSFNQGQDNIHTTTGNNYNTAAHTSYGSYRPMQADSISVNNANTLYGYQANTSNYKPLLASTQQHQNLPSTQQQQQYTNVSNVHSVLPLPLYTSQNNTTVNQYQQQGAFTPAYHTVQSGYGNRVENNNK